LNQVSLLPVAEIINTAQAKANARNTSISLTKNTIMTMVMFMVTKLTGSDENNKSI
jgi:hypothetical protein